MTGMSSPTVVDSGVNSPTYPTAQPFNSPSGSLGPPVVSLPPTAEPGFRPPVIDRPVIDTVRPIVNPIPDSAPPLRPQVPHPWEHGRNPLIPTDYKPEYWE